jgi:hypothetical protein
MSFWCFIEVYSKMEDLHKDRLYGRNIKFRDQFNKHNNELVRCGRWNKPCDYGICDECERTKSTYEEN